MRCSSPFLLSSLFLYILPSLMSSFLPSQILHRFSIFLACLPSLSSTSTTHLSVSPQGGTWGKYSGKSDVEWQIHRAASIPGPSDYDPLPLKKGVAVKFGDHNPMSDIDMRISAAKDLPVSLNLSSPPLLLSFSSRLLLSSSSSSSSFSHHMSQGPLDYAGEVLPKEKPKLRKLERTMTMTAKSLNRRIDSSVDLLNITDGSGWSLATSPVNTIKRSQSSTFSS